MGDKAVPYEPGDQCGWCWGDGKPFGDVITPKYLYMTGSGFPPICDNCNDTFVLTQDPVNHCFWWLDEPGLDLMYQLTEFGSHFFMGCPGDCFDFATGPCLKTITRFGRTVTIT